MSLGTILLIVLVIALLGGFSGLGGGPFYGTGYDGGGGLGLYEDLHDYVLFMVNTGLRPDESRRIQFRDVKIVDDQGSGETIHLESSTDG